MVRPRRLLLALLATGLLIAWTAPVQAKPPGMSGPGETLDEVQRNGTDPAWWQEEVEAVLDDPEDRFRDACRAWLPGKIPLFNDWGTTVGPNASRACGAPLPTDIGSSPGGTPPPAPDRDLTDLERTPWIGPSDEVHANRYETRPGIQDATVPVHDATGGGPGALVVGLAAILVSGALVVLHRYLSDDDVLDNDLRRRVLDLVRDRPGATPSDVASTLDVHYTTAVYHLETLSEFDHAVERRYGGRRRFFAYGTCRTRSALLDALAAEGRAEILDHLTRAKRSSVSEVVEAADLSQSTVSEHLSRLHDNGLVARERDGRRVIYRLTPDARRALAGDGASS